MFNKYTTRILIMLAHVLENWAEIILRNLNNKTSPATTELPSEPEFSLEGESDSPETGYTDTGANDQELRNSPNGGQLKDQPLHPGVTEEHEFLLNPDEIPGTVVRKKDTVPEPARLSYSRKNLNPNPGEQIEPHVSVAPSSEIENAAVNNDDINDRKKPDDSESSSPLNNGNFPAVENSTDNSTRQPQHIKQISEKDDNTGVDTPSKKISHEIIARQNESIDPSTNVSVHIPNPPGQQKSISSNTPEVEINESLDELHESVSSENQSPLPIIKGEETSALHERRSKANSIKHDQVLEGLTAPTTVTTDSRTRHATPQVPVTVESHWPKLPGEMQQISELQTDLPIYRWPELPIETDAAGVILLSTEALQATKALIREMERIRSLENEQKGMLWNT